LLNFQFISSLLIITHYIYSEYGDENLKILENIYFKRLKKSDCKF